MDEADDFVSEGNKLNNLEDEDKNKDKVKVTLAIVTLIGLALWGVMLKLTFGVESPNGLLIHLGETGATLAVLTVLGALVRQVFLERDRKEDRREQERHERRQKEKARIEFIRNLLADFKLVYDRVESCRLLIEAHRSAKTYGEQMRLLVDGVVTLHNIERALDPEFPYLQNELREPICEMNKFLKNLLNEFRNNYREISKLQEADEAWNKYQRENLPSQQEPPSKYSPFSHAWKKIEKLPKLSALCDDRRFEEYKSDFLVYLNAASATLRGLLPVDEIVGGSDP